MTAPTALRERGFLTTTEAAKRVGVHRNTIWTAIAEGRLKATRFGTYLGVRKQDADRFKKKYITPHPASQPKRNKATNNKRARGKK